MSDMRHYTVSRAVLLRNAKGGRATKKAEPRYQIPASRSTAYRLRKLVPLMKRRELVDVAVNDRLDQLENILNTKTQEAR